MKKVVVLSLLIILPLLSACSTMEGLGTDIKKGGQAIERAAKS